jgi:hypothetical protein
MSTDNVIAGQVVQADDDTAAEENAPPAPETYFHKVAGPQRSDTYLPGYAADETPVASDPTATDPDLPAVDPTAAGPDLPAAASDVNDADYLDDANELDDVADPDDANELDDPAPVADALPTGSALPAGGSVTVTSGAPEGLLGDTTTLMEQWRQAAVEFVDDPRASVGHAADVAAEAVSRLEAALRDRRSAWDGNGNGNGQTDTEALRQAILGYRRFLDRLLS